MTAVVSAAPFQVLFAAVAVLLAATGVPAQERGGRAYIQGGAVVLRQDGDSGVVSETYTTAPGGTTLGWSAGGGLFLAAHVSIEGEFATTGAMTATEPSRYGMTFHEERRDRFFWGAVRAHIPLGALADLEPVAGFGIVSTVVTSQTERAPCTGCTGPTTFDPKTTETVPRRPVFVFGCDARFGGAHLAFVPSFLAMRAGTYPDWPTYYPGGVSLSTISIGASVRVTF